MQTALANPPQQPSRSMPLAMTYVLLFMLAIGIGAVEYLHELSQPDANSAVCLAPQSKADAIGDLLLHHLNSH
jgi:hypothetical protein